MREMKDSGVEWLPKVPDGWRVIPFKHLFKEMDRPVQEGDEIITCFRDGEVTLRKNRREDGFTMADQEIGYQHISVGDLVVHGMDGFAGSIGISDSDGKATPVLIVMNPLHDECSRYFMYLLRVYAQLEVFLATSSGIRVRSCALNWKKLGSLPAVVPSVEEQKKIVAFLDERCAAIDEVRRTIEDEIEALRRLRKATIHKAVTKGLDENVPMRDSGIPWVGDMPRDWDAQRLKYLFKNLDSVRQPIDASKRDYDSDVLYPYYGASGIIDYVSGYLLNERTLLIGEDGANLRLRNLPVVYIADGKYWVNNHTHIIKPGPRVDFMYAYYQLELVDLEDFLTGMTMPKLTQANLNVIPFILPPLSEQRRIAEYLDERCAAIDSVIDTRTKQLQRLDDYRRALIFAYVTGKKEVPTHA